MSRGHKVLDTWFKNRQAQQNAQVPTAAQRKNYDDAKDTVKEPPFEPDAPHKPVAKAGKYGQGYSTARHLARLGMKSVKEDTTDLKEESEVQPTFMQMIESWETEKKKRHLRDALDRHTEKALAANRAGDDEAVRVHQQHMNRIKGQMAKLMRNEGIEDIYDATENQLDEISKATLGSYVNKSHDQLMKHTASVNMKYGRGDKDATAYALDKDALRKTANRTQGMKTAISKLTKEETELDEAWNINNRNPQRAVKIGSKVRSYDFPGMHNDHYIEGHVVGETPHSYHIKVGKVIRSGKEIPTPAHMSHVEAPKGKSIWTDAYAVHKLKEQTETNEQAVAPVEKEYYKGIRLHFAKGNRGGKSSSNKGGAADGGNGGSGGGNGGGDGA